MKMKVGKTVIFLDNCEVIALSSVIDVDDRILTSSQNIATNLCKIEKLSANGNSAASVTVSTL